MRGLILGLFVGACGLIWSGASAADPSPHAIDLARRLVAASLPNLGADLASEIKPADLDDLIRDHPEVSAAASQADLSAGGRSAVLTAAAGQAAHAVAPGYLDWLALSAAARLDEPTLQAIVDYEASPAGRAAHAHDADLAAGVQRLGAAMRPQLLAAVAARVCPGKGPAAPAAAANQPPAHRANVEAALRLLRDQGRYQGDDLPGYAGAVTLAEACPKGAPPDAARIYFLAAAGGAGVALSPPFHRQIATLYAGAFTLGELNVMAAFEESPAGQRLASDGIGDFAAQAFLVLELRAQFRAGACARLGCVTPPDAPETPWRTPAAAKLGLARKVAAEEVGNIDALMEAFRQNWITTVGAAAARDLSTDTEAVMRAKRESMLELSAQFYATAYSEGELAALDAFYGSPIGQSVLEEKRRAAAAAADFTFSPPNYTDAEKAALAAFNASPAGVSIRAKRREITLASTFLTAAMVARAPAKPPGAP
ncbi:MAG: DUF2059 domain-containing protein [Caulobacterales bacterium]